MVEFLSVVHIIVTVALCGLVLIQDSKGGGALGIGGSGSNSLLGATGAQTLAATLTKWVAVLFAVSCVALTYFLAHQNKSVIDTLGVATPATLSAPATTETSATPSLPAATAPGAEASATKDAAPTQAPSAPAAEPVKK